MKSNIPQKASKELKRIFKEKGVLDVILFGSFVKGKTKPKDIDAAAIVEDSAEKLIKAEIEDVHLSIITLKDFVNPPPIITTILKEGYSMRHRKPFAETFRFESRVLFSYSLSGLSSSNKVRAVTVLRGNKENGMVAEMNGKWIAQGVFVVPVSSEYIFHQFFIEKGIKFNKHYILMH